MRLYVSVCVCIYILVASPIAKYPLVLLLLDLDFFSLIKGCGTFYTKDNERGNNKNFSTWDRMILQKWQPPLLLKILSLIHSLSLFHTKINVHARLRASRDSNVPN